MTHFEYHTPRRALVVEDDLWMKPLIGAAIRAAIPGVWIDWVESAEEAIRRTRLFSYLLIIADVNLKPNQNTGVDLWHSCREECPEIPVLLMSSTTVDTFAKQMRMYSPHYLSKPFTVGECKEVIKNLVAFQCASS